MEVEVQVQALLTLTLDRGSVAIFMSQPLHPTQTVSQHTLNKMMGRPSNQSVHCKQQRNYVPGWKQIPVPVIQVVGSRY